MQHVGGIVVEQVEKQYWIQNDVMDPTTNKHMIFLTPLRYDINFGDSLYYVNQLRREYPLLYWRKSRLDNEEKGMTTVITEIVLHGNGDVIDGKQLVTNLKGHADDKTSHKTDNPK